MRGRLLSVALVRRVTRQEEEQMRIHRSVKMGLAAGVMLVAGGCAADTLAPHPAPAPREADLADVLAGRVRETPVSREIAISREARPPEGVGARIRICNIGGHQGPGKPLMIVDGEEIAHPEAHQLDPKRIESIEILRGPAAIAIYGHRAADGAILIRTKRP
jgi:TonB-dependent SusC/RagA subfamily outer membrane receptor